MRTGTKYADIHNIKPSSTRNRHLNICIHSCMHARHTHTNVCVESIANVVYYTNEQNKKEEEEECRNEEE